MGKRRQRREEEEDVAHLALATTDGGSRISTDGSDELRQMGGAAKQAERRAVLVNRIRKKNTWGERKRASRVHRHRHEEKEKRMGWELVHVRRGIVGWVGQRLIFLFLFLFLFLFRNSFFLSFFFM
jgi:hypothetical protein